MGKMDSEKRKAMMSIFLGLIIVLSVVSVVLYRKPTQEQDTKPNQTPSLPIGSFQARDIDATVAEMTSTYTFLGYTDNYNKDDLVSKIESTLGSKISSANYRPELSTDKTAFVFSAVLKTDSNIDIISKKLQDDNILFDVSAYRHVIAKVPTKITFKAIDSNETRDVNLEEPFISVIVSPDTEKEDKLKITIYAQLQGNQLVKGTMQAFEEQNLSSQLYFFRQDINAKIVSIENSFIFNQSFDYVALDTNNIETRLKALDGIDDALVQASVQKPLLFKIEFGEISKEEKEKLVQDLNEALAILKETTKKMKDFSVAYDENKSKKIELTVEFENSEESYAEVKRKVSEIINAKGLSYEIEDAKISLELQVLLKSSMDAKKRISLRDRIKEIFAENGLTLSNERFSEEGYIELRSVTRPDTNQVMPVTTPVRAVLAFGHDVGDYVEFEVTAYAQRKTLLGVFATEKALSKPAD
ncbi:MAG: hypothetical protein QXM75_03785 [Candidatus Diapherotrites archaeon]